MKKILYSVALLSACSLTASAQSYSTSFDNPPFTNGVLHLQDGWSAQTQWLTDGAGNVVNANGAFIRAHNTSVVGNSSIGEIVSVTTSITLGAFSTPSADIAVWEENIYQQALSHQLGNQAWSAGLGAGISYDVGTGNLELRANQGLNETGTSVVTVGAASGFGGTTFTLDTVFTKTGVDLWSVAVTLDDGINPVWSLNYTANSQDGNLDTAGVVIGGFQANPSGGGSGGVATPPFGPTTVHDFAINIVPEPTTLALLGLGTAGLLITRRRR